MGKILAIGVAVAALVAGGTYAVVNSLGDDPAPEDAAVKIVPEDAWLYVNLFIEPQGEQKEALDEVLARFPEVGSTDEALDKLTELLDKELEEIGMSYREDLEPWLGDQLAFFLAGDSFDPPVAAGLLETTDQEAAQAAVDNLQKQDDAEFTDETYDGAEYELEKTTGVPAAIGFVDDFLVVGTEVAFKAVVDASSDGALEASDSYTGAFEGLEDAHLLSLYVDQSRAFEIAERSGGLTRQDMAAFNAFPGLRDAGSAGMVLSARPEGLAFESSSGIPEGGGFDSLAAVYEGTDVIESLPADSWAALGIPDLGQTVKGVLDMVAETPGLGTAQQLERGFERELGLDLQEDVLSWMGDAGLFVQGTNMQEIGGGLVVESSDPDKTRATLDKVRQRMEAEGAPTNDHERAGYQGFSIQAGSPAPLYALAADRLIVAYGDRATDEAIEAEETLGEDPTYRRAAEALGDGYKPAIFVDVGGVLQLVDFFRGFSGDAAAGDTYERDVKPWLEPLEYVVAGSRRDGDRLYQTFFVGVREEEETT